MLFVVSILHQKPFVMKLLFSILILLSLTFCGTSQDEKPQPKEIRLTSEQSQIIDGANRFGFDLFQEVEGLTKQNENVFISPMSVHMALAMAWNGAAGNTRTQMAEAMYFPQLSDPKINEAYKRLLDDLLAVDDKVTIEIANSIWYRNTFNVKKNFLALNRDYFNARVSSLDFNDPASKEIINNWVAEKTRDKISQIVDEIEGDHVMFLINAIYFKGMWETEFKVENTHNRPFILADGSKKEVMTMEMNANFGYSERNGYRVVELPYGRGNFSMLVFLPDNEQDVNGLIKKLDIKEWNTLSNEMQYRSEIDLRLPRFGFSFEAELKKPLSNLGIREAFMAGPADFSGISDEEIYISRVRHKSFVEVNEEGTEAAAVTSVEFRETSISMPVQFHVDQPFLFALKEKNTNSLMFIGKVMDPEK